LAVTGSGAKWIFPLTYAGARWVVVNAGKVVGLHISPDRIPSLWYGQMNPVADNSTEEGRRLNRRVEIAVGGI